MNARQRRIALLVLLAVVPLVLPFVLPRFVLVQIVIKTLWLGTVAASLTFLARYGGMVSLAQTAIYGTAGYATALLTVKQGWNPWLAAGVAIGVAVAVSLLIGLISARSRDIYFLMLTLACAVFIYYFASQSPALGSHGGINGTPPPVLGSISFNDPRNFYFLALGVAVASAVLLRLYARTSLGLGLEGSRDCPERMESIGFNGSFVRVLGFVMAGVIAAFGGIISLWYNGQISPGSIDVVRTIDVLVAAVIGGIALIEGAWLGALVVALLATYATNLTDRAETLVGLIFIAVVLFSPGGLVGIYQRLRSLGSSAMRTNRSGNPVASALITSAPSED